MLVFGSLASVPGLVHGVTTREGGVSQGLHASLNLGRSSGDEADAVAENRRRAAAALGFRALTTARQVHGARVVVAARSDEDPGEADALLVDAPGVLVGALGADCPGVLIVDPARRALVVAHAGWRGAVAGVLRAALAALEQRHGSRPETLWAAIGPGISQRAYEVGPEVADALARSAPGASACVRPGRDDRRHVDLPGVLRLQLVAAGIPEANVEVSGRCTSSEPALFFSHRRDGALTGRHALLAGWRA